MIDFFYILVIIIVEVMYIHYIVEDEYDGIKMKDYLRGRGGFSHRMLIHVKNHGLALRSGIILRARDILHAGERIDIRFPPQNQSDIALWDQMIDIHYEDEFLLVVHKPPNMAVHPTLNYPDGTLANAIAGYYQKTGITAPVRILGRLDKGTSGLIVISKQQYVHGRLTDFASGGLIVKEYYALAHGRVLPECGTIDLPLARMEDSIIKRVVSKEGKHAVTHYQTVAFGSDCTLLKVILETGRTHQIRVHFAHIGHPLVGDWLYGNQSELISHHALQVFHLQFPHPISGKKMDFSLPLDADIEKLL